MHLYKVCSLLMLAETASVSGMKRNSPNDFSTLDDLSELNEKLVDKRQDKRSTAKKLRRNRHYERQFLKLAHQLSDTDPAS